MITLNLKAYEEAKIEEQEFYHLVSKSLDEENFPEETIEEFFGCSEYEIKKGERYPKKWKDQFYDPYKKRL